MQVLKIGQNEESRFKVKLGREVHKNKMKQNTDYLMKKIGVVRKIQEEELSSAKYHIHGKIDEILFLDNGTAAPLDYKFAEYKGKIFRTYKMQSILYGLLIQDNYNIKVEKGFIVYTRSSHQIIEIEHTEKAVNKTLKIIDEMVNIIERNYYPKRTSIKKRCFDCCYRNICVK
jgi:CRISPR-associated exonuclease Cas4